MKLGEVRNSGLFQKLLTPSPCSSPALPRTSFPLTELRWPIHSLQNPSYPSLLVFSSDISCCFLGPQEGLVLSFFLQTQPRPPQPPATSPSTSRTGYATAQLSPHLSLLALAAPRPLRQASSALPRAAEGPLPVPASPRHHGHTGCSTQFWNMLSTQPSLPPPQGSDPHRPRAATLPGEQPHPSFSTPQCSLATPSHPTNSGASEKKQAKTIFFHSPNSKIYFNCCNTVDYKQLFCMTELGTGCIHGTTGAQAHSNT